ncbi:MAG: MerR family regulatory protein [Cyanobacteria bacterium RYN_339]|nr:MerR family regulatory protein [Cyanobacteria bacterium RYN_339]
MPSSTLEPTAGGWLTPGMVARDAGVSPRTVQNWCNQGLLRCERLPSGHRRIPATAWALFKAGGGRAEQDAVATASARQDELEMRIRRASSPQEVMDLLLAAT